jgi:arylsulfatase
MGSHSLTAMGFPGYNAHPPDSAKGFGESLKKKGWSTMFIGKWDQTPQWESTFSGPFDRWPSGDGWEHFYGFMSGDMNNFNPIMWMDHTPVQPNYDAPGYHVNEDMADTAIRWISMQRASAHDKPFCMFWATGAVHAPHQAPREWIEQFRGKFDMGYDEARKMILARQIEMGIVPKGTKLSPRDPEIPAWDTLNDQEKALYARQMEAFAGQLAYSDYEFGRILDYLERIGELDNTLVIFTSDNGASGEGGLHGTFNENGFFNGVPNIPYEVNSQYINEWGNRVGVWHVTAGWTAVTQHKQRRPWQLDREGSIDTDVWELFNLKEDFSQSTNLADKHPEKLEELKALFEKEAEKYDVYPLDGNLGPRLKNMQAMAAPKDKELVYYPAAAIRVHESVSPPVKGKTHEFIAEVDIPASGGDGMLVTAGGRTAGYGLFIKNGRLIYVYNYLGIERTVLIATDQVPRGKSELRMKFTKTGEYAGDAELFINDKSVGKTHIAKTVPITFSIEETFDVGEDTGSPIIEDVYAVPFRCEALQKLTVKIEKN